LVGRPEDFPALPIQKLRDSGDRRPEDSARGFRSSSTP
jgi:hypothetical protein